MSVACQSQASGKVVKQHPWEAERMTLFGWEGHMLFFLPVAWCCVIPQPPAPSLNDIRIKMDKTEESGTKEQVCVVYEQTLSHCLIYRKYVKEKKNEMTEK